VQFLKGYGMHTVHGGLKGLAAHFAGQEPKPKLLFKLDGHGILVIAEEAFKLCGEAALLGDCEHGF
jgi:hypothetical protein